MSINRNTINTRTAALVGMLGAISAVLMMIDFSLPLFPSFMKFDLGELPALFGGFFLGPMAGCLIIVIKMLLKLLIKGTSTAFVGEFMNIIASVSYVLPAALIYKNNHTKNGAKKAMLISTIFTGIVCVFLNAYISFPMYGRLYGLSMEAIVGMASKVNPLVHDNTTLMLFSVFPFNLFKYGVTSILTYLIYKRTGNTIRRILDFQN
ncbi:MAG: ECF transporter S component [Lachnospiraceae bacterium]|nr:ECF transporter S component [Lachnospiraceae bacterium]